MTQTVTRWEYLEIITNIDTSKVISENGNCKSNEFLDWYERLKMLGIVGWEMVSSCFDPEKGHQIFYFKRIVLAAK